MQLQEQSHRQLTVMHCNLLWISSLVLHVQAFPSSQELIPNGKNVYQGEWPGVGHLNPGGGGPRNPFGLDFAEAGKQWTKELCEKDSDGDGLSNGLELGDPDCTWTPGTTPKFTTGIRHPGMDDSSAQEAIGVDSCKDYVAPTKHQITNFTFKEYKLQTVDRTTYACRAFEFPSDKTRWITQFKPVVHTREVLHHFVLFLCAEPSSTPKDTARLCNGMSAAECPSVLYAWAVGAKDFCLPEGVGIPVGGKGRVHAVLEIHYDNPSLFPAVDSSGVSFTLAEEAPTYDAGFMFIGEFGVPLLSKVAGSGLLGSRVYADTLDGRGIRIPPRVRTEHVFDCPSSCQDAHFQEGDEVTVFGYMMHAHFLARSVKAERIPRGGSDADAQLLAEEKHYSYDLQQMRYVPPSKGLKIKYGDRLRTTCVFDSHTRTFVTSGGENTAQEMCIGGLYYYPAKASWTFCLGKNARARPNDQSTLAICGQADSENVNSLLLVDSYGLQKFSAASFKKDFDGYGSCKFSSEDDVVGVLIALQSASQACKSVAEGREACDSTKCALAMQTLMADGCVAMAGMYNLQADWMWELGMSFVPDDQKPLLNLIPPIASQVGSAMTRCGVCTDDRECAGNSVCECVNSSIPINKPGWENFLSPKCQCSKVPVQASADDIPGIWSRPCEQPSQAWGYSFLGQLGSVATMMEEYEFGSDGHFKHIVRMFSDLVCDNKNILWTSTSNGSYVVEGGVEGSGDGLWSFAASLAVTFDADVEVVKTSNDHPAAPASQSSAKEIRSFVFTPKTSTGTPFFMQQLIDRKGVGKILEPPFTKPSAADDEDSSGIKEAVSIMFVMKGIDFASLSNDRAASATLDKNIQALLLVRLPKGFTEDQIDVSYSGDSVRASVDITFLERSNQTSLIDELSAKKDEIGHTVLRSIVDMPMVSDLLKDGKAIEDVTVTATILGKDAEQEASHATAREVLAALCLMLLKETIFNIFATGH